MRRWATEIRAIHPYTGHLVTWEGDVVLAPTMKLAQDWCDTHKGYLKVIGELIAEIPCKIGTYEPDWDNRIDYDFILNN